MNHEKMQHDRLAQLGEELLQEFEEVNAQPISGEFDRKFRDMLSPARKKPAQRIIRLTARAAVIAFALVGALTVAVLSIDALRMPLIKLAVEHYAREQETRWDEFDETVDFEQISFASTENMTLSVSYDGNENYQVLFSDEFGQRLYHFQASGLEAAFFEELTGSMGAAAE